MKSFDPDADEPSVEPGDDAVTFLDTPVTVDAAETLAVLERIATALPGGGELREGQQLMATAIADSFSTTRHLVVEAGTGVGKSLAYLVPSALSGQRVVIATATKNLQDQLARKDAPAVADATGRSVAVLKGWSNYLCRVRLADVGGGVQMTFDDGSDVPATMTESVKRLVAWSELTTTGERDDAPFEVNERAWRAVSVTPQECVGRATCPRGSDCFAALARDRAASADPLIVNTPLYASHLAAGGTVLPPHDYVVFDEAHEVQDIFASMLGTSITVTQLRAVAQSCRTLLAAINPDKVAELNDALDRFEDALVDQLDRRQEVGLGEAATEALSAAGTALTALVEDLKLLPDDPKRARVLGPSVHVLGDLDRLLHVGKSEILYLRRDDRVITVNLSLIEVGGLLADSLWLEVTGILTSATIPSTLVRDLGLPSSARQLSVPSPFDYQTNARLYVPTDIPDRNDDGAEAAIIEEITTLVRAAGGRTLALFTNRSVMERVASAVNARVDTPILVQGTLSRAALTKKFKEDEHSSLFAVASYWQGVDVPGSSLSVVVIDRLPFRRPDDPVAEARRERSDNPFFEVDLPRATMMLAQGVGRLIRSTTDKGVVAVLDPRLAKARYRKVMLDKLPPMKRVIDRADVVAFLRELTAD